MFGYLPDISSKAAGYCRHNRSKGEAVLLFYEADVGSIHAESAFGEHTEHE